MCNDGVTPYGPTRFKNLVKELYFICKTLNISYNDALDMSFPERSYMLSFIKESQDAERAAIDDLKAQQLLK